MVTWPCDESTRVAARLIEKFKKQAGAPKRANEHKDRGTNSLRCCLLNIQPLGPWELAKQFFSPTTRYLKKDIVTFSLVIRTCITHIKAKWPPGFIPKIGKFKDWLGNQNIDKLYALLFADLFAYPLSKNCWISQRITFVSQLRLMASGWFS